MAEFPTERLFIAIDIPQPVKQELVRLQRDADGIAWTPPDQFHVTLRFLGDVPGDRRDALDERLARVHVEPFILPIEGVGAFPPKGPPRVVWAGTGAGHPRLFQLRQQVDDAILAAGLDVDMRTFHAHVTLGRCAPDSAPAVKTWIFRHASLAAAPFKVDGFNLISSVLQSTGAKHMLRRRFAM
jgi:2'-5' RNA ligase